MTSTRCSSSRAPTASCRSSARPRPSITTATSSRHCSDTRQPGASCCARSSPEFTADVTRTRLFLLIGLAYLTLFVCLDFLRFAPEKDELHFWPTALLFSKSWIPSLDQLRGYHELSTPLAFLVFGGLEHLLHGGIMAGRLLNLSLSFGMTAVIMVASDDSRRPALAIVGLFVFP